MIPQTNVSWTLLTAIALVISTSQWIQLSTPPQPDLLIYSAQEVDVAPFAKNLDLVKELIGKPDLISDAGLSGNISFAILVDTQGYYNKHKIIGEPHPLFEAFSEPFVPILHFEPALLAGKKVRCWTTVQFSF